MPTERGSQEMHWTLYPPGKEWPLWARRTFFITLPISGPLWFALVIFALGFVTPLMLVVVCFIALKGRLWDAD